MTGTKHLVVGPAEHGVVRFAEQVVGALNPGEPPVRTTWRQLREDPAAVLAPLGGGSLVHTQYTDRLFGPRCEESADLFKIVGQVLARKGCRLSVTLHDLPPGPGELTAGEEPLQTRRASAYRRVAGSCAGVIVSSEHERTRLSTVLTTAGPPVVVIPLPIDRVHSGPVQARPVRDVTVLGFLYPGKGHREVLQAMVKLPADISMTALGRPSEGHEDLVPELRRQAGAAGRTLRVTGFVPDHALTPALHAAGIPVAPYCQVSASGSIATWLGAGRRPLVPDIAYTREVEHRCPGALWRYDPRGEDGSLTSLPEALADAVAHPERTWLGATTVGPDSAHVMARYADALRGWS